MTYDQALVARYLPLIDAELVRIGFTEHDFRYLGSGGPLSEQGLEKHLAHLRTIPSSIGAQAYFARLGVDFAKLKQGSSQLPPR